MITRAFSIHSTGGDILQSEIKRLASTHNIPTKNGTVLQTLPGNLPCKHVFHIIRNETLIVPWTFSEFKSAFFQCMDQAALKAGAESIAFSLFPSLERLEQLMVRAMLEAVVSSHSLIKEVLFISHQPYILKHVSCEVYRLLSDKGNCKYTT